MSARGYGCLGMLLLWPFFLPIFIVKALKRR